MKVIRDGGNNHLSPLLQICKLVRHMAPSDSLQVAAKYTEINVRIYAPQLVTAANTLAMYPTSKIAKENLEGKFFNIHKPDRLK